MGSDGREEYESGKYYRKKEELKLKKKMKMKIFNFLSKIATACKIWSQILGKVF